MSVDSVNDVEPRVQYEALAAQDEFDYTFPIFEDGDLVVQVDGATLTLTTDYTVIGAGDDNGGTVTLVSPLDGGEIVTLYRDLPIERTSDFQQNGPMRSTSMNDELDRMTMWMQQLESRLGRGLRLAISDAVDSADLELSPLSNWENKYLAFDANGKPEPALLSATTMTQSIIGQLYRPEIDAEATVTIVNYFQEYADPRRYGAVCNGVTDDRLALIAADTVAAVYGISIAAKGVMHIGSATTINSPIADTLAQLFSITSQITLAGTPFVRPEWFGSAAGNIKLAINALPSTGGIIELEDKTYGSSGYAYGFAGAANCPSKDNLIIRGKKMPKFTSDCKALEGGTIIQGMFNPWANGIELSNLGIDNGYTISQTLYGGEAAAGLCDALVLTYPTDAIKAAAGLKLGAKLHNVVGLCYGPATLGHALILGEGYKNVTCTGEVIGMYGLHGAAIKCLGLNANQITTYSNGSDGVIIKSDSQATAVAGDIQINDIVAKALGPPGYSPYAVSTTGIGVYFHASGNNMSRIQIGQIQSYEYPICFTTDFSSTYAIDDVQIGSIITEQITLGGTKIGVRLYGPIAGTYLLRWRIGSVHARNCTLGVQSLFTQSATLTNHVSIGELSVVNATNALQIGLTSYLDIGQVNAVNCSDAVYQILNTPNLKVGGLFKDTTTPKFYSNSGGGLAPALAGTWTQFAANDPFNVDLLGGKLNLRGLVVPGATNVVSVLPQWAWPTTSKRFMVQGYNGAATVAVPLTVDTTGNVKVNEVAGGVANCTTWLSLSGVTYDALA